MLSVWILVTGENREIMAPCQQLLAFRRPEENGKRQLVKLLNVYREFWGIWWSEIGISVSISVFLPRHWKMNAYSSVSITLWDVRKFWIYTVQIYGDYVIHTNFLVWLCGWIFVVPVQLNHSDDHHLFIITANVHTQLIRELCVNFRSSHLSNCSWPGLCLSIHGYECANPLLQITIFVLQLNKIICLSNSELKL